MTPRPPSGGAPTPTCSTCGQIAERGPRSCTNPFHVTGDPTWDTNYSPSPVPASPASGTWPRQWAVPSDAELIEQAERVISDMCKGDRWRMSIPAQPTDSDIVLAEIIQRFKGRAPPPGGTSGE